MIDLSSLGWLLLVVVISCAIGMYIGALIIILDFWTKVKNGYIPYLDYYNEELMWKKEEK